MRTEQGEPDLRQALCHVVNVLGAPGPLHHGMCEGCEAEREEAILSSLEALGYLEVIETLESDPDVSPRVIAFEYRPEPREAWRAFMLAEYGIEVPE